MTVTHDESPVR